MVEVSAKSKIHLRCDGEKSTIMVHLIGLIWRVTRTWRISRMWEDVIH